MDIVFYEETQSFHLFNEKISYQLAIEEAKYVAHHYWGKRLNDQPFKVDYPRIDRSFSPNPSTATNREFSLNTLLQEFPGNNNGDYRESAFDIHYQDGSFVSQLEFESYEITEGKNQLKGLPQTYSTSEEDSKTLSILLKDHLDKVKIELKYTIFKEYAVLTRSVNIMNTSEEVVVIEKALSSSVDFPHANMDMIQLPGAWIREREFVRHPIHRGVTKIDSKRGTTSHTYQPFVGLLHPNTTEHQGEVFGFHFVYSGEFTINVEVDEYEQTRVQTGITPEHFKWTLKPEDNFQTPEVVLVYSDKGLNGMSQELHQFYTHHLIRGKYQKGERPVLINNWEATYFDFTEEKIEEIVKESVQLGIELFVLDDGWFGRRDDDTTSLGDWVEYREKIPNGLKALAEKVKEKGMKFGLWFEPEMISEESNLFKEHPDWILGAQNARYSTGRSQYILDFSRKEVRDHIVAQMKNILNQVPIDYIKWDYNRNMTEIGSQNPEVKDGEVVHRNMLGLYEVLEDLVSSYPDILWESCSGGGGRFDPGMLYYMPQTWTSDNTDAIERLKIQYSTSLLMPISSMASHVSAVPNHQVGRTTSLAMRGDVAMAGNLGYELDVTKLSSVEKESVKEQIAWYKKNRQLIQYGDFYRLLSPYESTQQTSWMFIDKEKDRAVVFYYQMFERANKPFNQLKLVGLDPNKKYQINNKAVRYGDELMYRGIYIDPPLFGDYQSVKLELKSV